MRLTAVAHFRINRHGAIETKARVVALWWESAAIPEEDAPQLAKIFAKLPKGSGLYAITGSHDANRGDGVLYVGESARLGGRVPESIEERLFEVHGDKKKRMCADVWNLTVRWASLDGELLRKSVESLLIMSHLPPFNSQHVAGPRQSGPPVTDQDLFVMSAGRKGPLLPVVSGAYQSSWRDKNGRVLKLQTTAGEVRARP